MSFLVEHLKMAYENAEQNESKIDQGIKDIDGFSGIKTRHLYNNLLAMKDAVYLEIGSYKGSTLCAALKDNAATVVCMDNWCEFGCQREEFEKNLNRYRGNNDVTVIEDDCFTVDVATLPKFNIYMYDGFHNVESHYNALTHFIDCMQDEFIFIVDDWNWDIVRDGTLAAIRDLNLKVLYEKDIRLPPRDASWPFHADTWWNGIYMCVLSKI